MSTEHKNEPETTALAAKLVTGWEQFKQGKLIGYKVMALILLLVAGLGLFLYIRSEQGQAASKIWVELEGVSTVADEKKFADANLNTVAGRIAALNVAKYQLAVDGIDKLLTRDEGERKKAVENIEQARDAMVKLADEFKAEPVLRAECYLGLAKAEAALVGLTKEGKSVGGVASPGDSVGSVGKVTEWLDKLAEVADGTPWGDDAKKLSATLKNPSSPVAEELKRVQTNLYNTATFPGGGPTTFPGGGPHGGFPPGFPGGGLGGLPGDLFGPGPASPGTAPTPPAVTPTPPVGPAPIPPSLAPLTPGGTPSTPAPPAPPPPAEPKK